MEWGDVGSEVVCGGVLWAGVVWGDWVGWSEVVCEWSGLG